MQNKRGQGTVEYLVIIGIVIVLSLVVVGLVLSQAGSASNVSVKSSELSSKVSVISLSEVQIDSGGNAILVLSNNGSENISLNSINVGNQVLYLDGLVLPSFGKKVVYLNKGVLSASSISQPSLTLLLKTVW